MQRQTLELQHMTAMDTLSYIHDTCMSGATAHAITTHGERQLNTMTDYSRAHA